MPERRRGLTWWAAGAALVLGGGLLLPEPVAIPVEAATPRDWHPHSFWHEPWGASGVHKGIDIFAPAGQPVVSAVPGVVLYRGEWGRGGHVVAVLGPRWRLHYYAHLQRPRGPRPVFVAAGQPLGSVGTSGNAAGKPAHLHYAVLSLLPRPWAATRQTQGWKRMFFVDPHALLAPPASSSGAS